MREHERPMVGIAWEDPDAPVIMNSVAILAGMPANTPVAVLVTEGVLKPLPDRDQPSHR